jgi:hypothetical protein
MATDQHTLVRQKLNKKMYIYLSCSHLYVHRYTVRVASMYICALYIYIVRPLYPPLPLSARNWREWGRDEWAVKNSFLNFYPEGSLYHADYISPSLPAI